MDRLASSELSALFNEFNEGVTQLASHKEQKPFRPHITLARLSGENPELVDAIQQYRELSFGSWRASEVICMQSTLTPAGSHYSALAEIPLGNSVQ